MKNNKRKDKRSIDKIKTLIISIIVSIILWVAIVNVVNPDVTETFYDIRIQTNGISSLREKGFVVVNSAKLPTCSVKIKGKRQDIIDSVDKIYAVVNVSDIARQGKSTVPVIINSPSAVNLESQNFSTVEVEIEPCYEKEIPITVKHEETPKGKLIKSVPENETIKISGSKKDLEKINSCLVTANLSEIVSDTNTMYPFTYLSDDKEPVVKPDTIYCSAANILVYHTVYDKKTAPLDLKIDANIKDFYRINLNTDELSEKTINYGTKNDSLIPEKISYTLDITDIKEGENEIKLKAEEIEDVYIPKNQLTLNFKAERIITKDTSISVTTENLADGYRVSDIVSSSKYSLSGTEKELSEVKATVDLAGLTEGSHRLPLKFNNEKIQPTEPCFVTVVIARKED